MRKKYKWGVRTGQEKNGIRIKNVFRLTGQPGREVLFSWEIVPLDFTFDERLVKSYYRISVSDHFLTEGSDR
jgi:hypothetical protein